MAEEIIRFRSIGEEESIAESHIREQLRNIARKLEEEVRELLFVVRDLDEGKVVAVEKRYGRVRNMKDSIETDSVSLMEYLIKTSPALTLKDVYANIVQDVVRVAEHTEAAAYRSLLLSRGEFERMPDNIYVVLDETLRKILNMVGIVGSMVEKLGSQERLLREYYIELLKLENSVDEFYREAGIQVIKYYSNRDIGALILVKELFDKLEDAADMLKRVGTYIRYASISR